VKVKFSYFAQVRQAAGAESEEVMLADGADLAAALAEVSARHGPAFRTLVLDDAGAIRPNLMVLVNGAPAAKAGGRGLADGDEVTVLSAVSGG